MAKANYLIALAIFAGSAFASPAAIAGKDVIKERKELMKGVGKALKASKPMFKDEFLFQAKAAAAHMAVVEKAATGVVPLFPVGSETGGETTVLPTIWQDKKDFEARLAKLAAAAKAAGAATAKGHGAFAKAFSTMVKSCKGCHETYRQKKK